MPTISEEELRNDSDEILRRAEAGERFTITVGGRPVAEIVSAIRRQWVDTSALGDLFARRADPTLGSDIDAFGGELRDPWSDGEG
jgi:prevent-host-death family protein